MRELNKPDIDRLAVRFQIVRNAGLCLTFEDYLLCPDVFDERARRRVAASKELLAQSSGSARHIHLN